MLSLVPLRVWAGLALVVALAVGWWRLTAFYERKGYERRAAEDTAAMVAQQDRNRELQRTAELKYTVQQGVRDRFITQIITEVRHATENLAACVLTPDAVRRLRDAAECASGDSPASCGPDLAVHGAAPAR